MSHPPDESVPASAGLRPHRFGIIGGLLLGLGGAVYLTDVLLAAPGHIHDWARASMFCASSILTVCGGVALVGGCLERRQEALLHNQSRLRREIRCLARAIADYGYAPAAAGPLPRRRGRADAGGTLPAAGSDPARSATVTDPELRAYLTGWMDNKGGGLGPADTKDADGLHS